MPGSIHGQYELVSYAKDNKLVNVNEAKSNITIDTKANSIACNVGCNSIGGEFKTRGQNIEPMRLISTEMYCEKVAEMERQVVDNLGEVNNYTILKDRVKLNKDMNVLLILKRK